MWKSFLNCSLLHGLTTKIELNQSVPSHPRSNILRSLFIFAAILQLTFLKLRRKTKYQCLSRIAFSPYSLQHSLLSTIYFPSRSSMVLHSFLYFWYFKTVYFPNWTWERQWSDFRCHPLDFEFSVIILLEWLPTNPREPSLLCYLSCSYSRGFSQEY